MEAKKLLNEFIKEYENGCGKIIDEENVLFINEAIVLLAIQEAFDLGAVVGRSEQLVCECGNKLTDKELYFGQCLQCDKNIEEAN
jgi:hypothetical protein